MICLLLTAQQTAHRAAGLALQSSATTESYDDTHSDGDDVIELNVGGERITTLRSTLTAIPNSTLALMFATTDSDSRNVKDTQGAVFLDYNPEQFKYLLDQLREIKRTPTLRPYEIEIQAPKIDTHSNFSHMIADLGLNRK